jgi:O-antigen ligase
LNIVIENPVRALSFLLLLSLVSLDVSFGITGFKLGNVLLVITCLLITVFTIGSVYKKKLNVEFNSSDKLYLLFIFLVLSSALWSPSPFNAIFQAGVMFLLWTAALYISSLDMTRFIKQFINIAVAVAVCSILLIPIAPDIAFQPNPSGAMPELRGIFHHQLRFGLYMAIALGFLVLIWLNNEIGKFFRSQLGYYFSLVIVLVALILSFARLYTFFAVFALFLVVIFSGRRSFKLIHFILLTIFIGLLVLYSEGLIFFLDAMGIDTTLTGRVRIWDKSLELASEANFLGYGFASFDHQIFDRLWGFYRPAHAHNSFIQVYFELGIMGFIILLFLVASHFKELYLNNTITSKYSYAGFVYFLTVLGSLTGANYASKPTLLFSVLLIVIAIHKNPEPTVKLV